MENTPNIAESCSVQKIMERNKTNSFDVNLLICIRDRPDKRALASSWLCRIISQKTQYQIFTIKCVWKCLICRKILASA